jgi:hypothetical protein
MKTAISPMSSAILALLFCGFRELHSPAMPPGPNKDLWLFQFPIPCQSLPRENSLLWDLQLTLFIHTTSLCHSLRVRSKNIIVRNIGKIKKRIEIQKTENKIVSSGVPLFLFASYSRLCVCVCVCVCVLVCVCVCVFAKELYNYHTTQILWC